MAATSRAKKSATHRMLARDLGIRVPRSGTNAYCDFIASFRQINSFLGFLLHTVGASEQTAKVAHDALVKIESDPAKREKMLEDWKNRRGPLAHLRDHRQFLMEVVLVRHVENYLNFLSSLLREIFLTKPEALRSSEKIDLETVLRHDSIEDLVKTITERKVDALSYSSFSDLANYFLEKFGVSLVPDADKATIVDAIETRNLSVHNRCVVNHRFLSRTGGDPSTLGKLKDLVIDPVEGAARIMLRSVLAVDRDARRRLKVQGHRLKTSADAK